MPSPVVYYCDVHSLDLPEGHRFPAGKYALVRERLSADGFDLRLAPAAPTALIELVHDSEYVSNFLAGRLSPAAVRRLGFPWSPGLVKRTLGSLGGTLAAADDALANGWGANLAGGTHHAFRDHGEGYCVFNDVAVAARVLLREQLISRAMVIDCDVHQGNGTASIFRGDSTVFTLSFHGEKNYPFRKETSDCDVTFIDGAGDDEYLSALEEHVPPLLETVRPDIVFYLAGADPYEGDRLGRLKMTIAGLRSRDRFVFEQCRVRGLPVVVAMSGGYAPDVEAIVEIHVNTIAEASRPASQGLERCASTY